MAVTKQERSWILYDWANSAYTLVITTAILPIFFKTYAAADLPDATSTAYWGYANSISMLVTGKESPRSLGGPVFIAQVAGESARTGFSALIGFMAFLSINLAILNLLPIPALDGGHLVYLIIEGIIRRPIPLKVKMFIQQVGLALILALMLFVIYNDIVRTLGK